MLKWLLVLGVLALVGCGTGVSDSESLGALTIRIEQLEAEVSLLKAAEEVAWDRAYELELVLAEIADKQNIAEFCTQPECVDLVSKIYEMEKAEEAYWDDRQAEAEAAEAA